MNFAGSSITFWALAALLAAIAIGCDKPSGGAPVRGNVSYRGEAIGKGTVTFFPSSGRPVLSVISPSGEYETTLPPGDYVVVIGVGVELPEGRKEFDPIPEQKVVLPPQYTSRVRSRLKAHVAADQQEPIDFHLE